MPTFLNYRAESPDFFHTFTVHFALAPVVLHPRQNGGVNLERWLCFPDSSKKFAHQAECVENNCPEITEFLQTCCPAIFKVQIHVMSVLQLWFLWVNKGDTLSIELDFVFKLEVNVSLDFEPKYTINNVSFRFSGIPIKHRHARRVFCLVKMNSEKKKTNLKTVSPYQMWY